MDILRSALAAVKSRGARPTRRQPRDWHPPLLYYRALARAESDAVWRAVEDRWGDDVSYPLIQGAGARRPTAAELVAFDAAAFAQAVPPSRLRALLAAHGVERVWELNETGPDWEIDVGLLEPAYGGIETHWTSEALDWMLYASHERSLTVGGAWLVAALAAAWPAWAAHVW